MARTATDGEAQEVTPDQLRKIADKLASLGDPISLDELAKLSPLTIGHRIAMARRNRQTEIVRSKHADSTLAA